MSAKEQRLSQADVKAVLRYYPASGRFYWLKGQRRGRRAGNLMKFQGHRNITINGMMYYEHRLAWLYMNGAWPSDMIDHRNGDRADNSLSNLRPCNRSVNQQNQRRAQKNNQCGYLGVSPWRGKFQATILSNGKKIRLGSFNDPAEAHEAYLQAKRRLHQGCEI